MVSVHCKDCQNGLNTLQMLSDWSQYTANAVRLVSLLHANVWGTCIGSKGALLTFQASSTCDTARRVSLNSP